MSAGDELSPGCASADGDYALAFCICCPVLIFINQMIWYSWRRGNSVDDAVAARDAPEHRRSAMRKFDEVKPLERMAAEAALASDDTEQICQALVSIAFYEQDWPWVQEQCLVLLSSKASAIRGLAATCVGHIARMHGQ